MEIKNSGQLIKALRNLRTMTQMELAEDICSVKELRRIEQGNVSPSLYTYEKILVKLGVNPSNHALAFTEESDRMAYIMMREIEELVFDREYKTAEEKYNFFKSQSYFNKDDIFQKQFVLFNEAVFLLELNNNARDALLKVTEAIEITLPGFELKYLDNHQLTHYEYRILNSMALIYNKLGDVETCIDILLKIKESLFKRAYLEDMRNRLLPTNCYNLSKYLGKQERYDEAISVCDEGIQICKEAKTFKNLGDLYYNKAYNLYHTNKINEAKQCFKNAFNIYQLSEDIEMVKVIKENTEKMYGILLND